MTTRLAINELRSARTGRERYTGGRLPEPITTDGHELGAANRTETTARARQLGLMP